MWKYRHGVKCTISFNWLFEQGLIDQNRINSTSFKLIISFGYQWRNLPPESSLGSDLVVELLKLQRGWCGRFDSERFVSGARVSSPSTVRWADGESQHSSSCHGRSTAPEWREAPSSCSKHRAPAHSEAWGKYTQYKIRLCSKILLNNVLNIYNTK